MAQEVAILDFGSGTITVYIGQRGVNDTINITCRGECDYDGFSDGKWFAPEQLKLVIGRTIANAETNARSKIKHLYIGVPGEFTVAECRDVSISFGKKHKITEEDIDALHEQGDVYKNDAQYTLINSQPIYYCLDDERRWIQPIGNTSQKLSGHISYILAENKFIQFIDQIMGDLGITSVEYVSSMLAETLFLLSEDRRDRIAVLIDVGHITTSVVVARGDGILSLSSFSQGGGHITADLSMYLKIKFSKAESLKRKVCLSLKVSEADMYELNENDGLEKYPAQLVNEIVMHRINIIAATIKKALKNCKYDLPEYIDYYITGGGLSCFKGIKDYLSKQFDKNIEIVAPAVPQLMRPQMSSILGLMDMVLSQQLPEKKPSLISKIFGKKN